MIQLEVWRRQRRTSRDRSRSLPAGEGRDGAGRGGTFRLRPRVQRLRFPSPPRRPEFSPVQALDGRLSAPSPFLGLKRTLPRHAACSRFRTHPAPAAHLTRGTPEQAGFSPSIGARIDAVEDSTAYIDRGPSFAPRQHDQPILPLPYPVADVFQPVLGPCNSLALMLGLYIDRRTPARPCLTRPFRS